MVRTIENHPALDARIAGFPPELKLLLAVSHQVPAADRGLQAERIAALARAGIHWETFLTLARHHGVAGLAAAFLAETGAVPGWVEERLRRMALAIAGRALWHSAELVRLNRLFAGRGIDLMALKGTTLSQRLYGNPALRAVGDIDVQVRLEDLDRAEAVLGEEGYVCVDPDFPMTPRMRRAVLERTHHFHYRHPARKLHVELHWRHDFWSPAQLALVWDRRIRMAWMGTELQELDDDALLLYLCYHGARHTWILAKWLSDIAAILLKPRREPWSGLFQLAAALDLELPLAQAAALVRALYRFPLPPPLARFVEAQAPSGVFLALPLATLRAGHGGGSLLGTLGRVPARFRYVVRLKKRVSLGAYLKILAFRPEETARFNIPDRWFWLHSLVGPLLWIRRRVAGAPRGQGLA